MNAGANRRRMIAITLSFAGMVIIQGCSGDDSGLDRRYKVSGKVTYKGEPVAKGTIAFEPTNPPAPKGRIASGYIENGSYTLTTLIDGDGAMPGEYKVIINSTTVDMTGLAKQKGGLVHQGDADFQKILKEGKSLVPAKYGKSETSGLTKKIEATSNTIDFDLKDE
jgi:major membrane immunogen (membrane-anchored lipoprotein)